MSLAAPATAPTPPAGPAAARGAIFETSLERAVGFGLMAAFAGFLVQAVVERRALFADGSHYLLAILATGRVYIVDQPRLASLFLYQWPAVLAVDLGATDRGTVGALLGVGYLYLCPATLAIAWAVLPASRKGLMLFPVLSVLCGWMVTCFTEVAEAPVLALWYWPMVFALLYRPPERRRDVVLLAALALPMAALYEIIALIGPLLAGIALWRWRRAGARYGWVWVALALWFLAAAGFGLHGILVPRDPGNRDGMLRALLGLRLLWRPGIGVNWPLVLGLATLPLLALCAWRPRALARGAALWLPPVALLAAFVALAPLLPRVGFSPQLSFSARGWPPLLVVLLTPALLAAHRGRLRLAGTGRRLAMGLLALVAAAQIAWQVAATAQWAGYLEMFEATLASRQGLVPFAETPLARPAIGIQRLAAFNWGWTNPSLSILLAPGPRVATLVAVSSPDRWQPFDPTDPAALPRIPGIDYTAYLAALRRPAAP